MVKALFNFFKGIFIGIANIIPGVSGGTIAVVLNVFDEMIEAINNFFKNFKKNFLFLLPIVLGAGFGIVAFSSLLKHCVEHYSFPTSMLFIGLVVGSIPLIFRKADQRKHGEGFDYKKLVYLCAALLTVVLIYVFKGGDGRAAATEITTGYMLWIFVGGVIASAAMIIPGISGSFVMVMLGLYNTVITGVSQLKDCLMDLSNTDLIIETMKILVPMGIGVIVGVVLISKLIGFLFKKHSSETYFAILGLIFGSIFGIFSDPATYQSDVNLAAVIWGIVCFAAGTALSLLLGKK